MSLTTKQILALRNLPGVGPKTILKLGDISEEATSDSEIYGLLCQISKSLGKKITSDQVSHSLIEAQKILAASEALGISCISYYEKNYPSFLRDAVDSKVKHSPVIALFYKGDLSLLSMDTVAVIGARECSSIASKAGRLISSKLASRGFCIVSGLAVGCDTAAHEGALEATKGKTIAVLANGLDAVYPNANKKLAENILAEGGLLISENIIGTAATNYNLVARNRIQAAISRAVIVVQSSLDGGSMHAALIAHKTNKPLYAVKFNDEQLNASPSTEGNRFLVHDCGAEFIGGYKNMNELDSDLDRISENIRKSL